MKYLGFLIVGFISGFWVAKLSARVSETQSVENVDELRDRISDRLDSLERSYRAV